MAAVAYPVARPRPRPAEWPVLRPVPSGAHRSRPSAATYRRRRLAAVVLLIGVVVAGRWLVAGLGGGPLTVPEAPAAGRAAHARVVQPGDTVWSVVREAHPAGDIRPLVDRIVAERGGQPLQPGETLIVP